MNLNDMFVFAPSCLLTEAELVEGKALGTAREKDLNLVRNIVNTASLYPYSVDLTKDPPDKSGRTVGKRKVGEVQERTKRALLSSIIRFQSGKTTEQDLRKSAVKTMKTAWRDVFLAGVRAGGVPGNGAGKGKTLVSVHDGVDDAWLKGAMTHEMRFLNGFLAAIIDDDYKMPLDRRAQMYVNALTSFYESARVIALPGNVLLHWVGPNDKKTCEGCAYMFEHSPYTKLTLPTTPRAGATPCLTNCRDRILVRRTTMKEVDAITEESKFSRERHIVNLNKIKRGG